MTVTAWDMPEEVKEKYNSRGFYIGDYIYVATTGSMMVLTLDGFTPVASLDYAARG